MNYQSPRHGQALSTENIAAQDGGHVGASVAQRHTPVICESGAAAAGYARNHIRFHISCEECGGTGRYSIAGGNNPYARLYECDVCQGTGVLADDEECAA